MCPVLPTGGFQRAWVRHLVNIDGSSNDPMCSFTIIFQHFMFSMFFRIIVKSGVWPVGSSGGLADSCYLDTIFDSDYHLRQVIETA